MAAQETPAQRQARLRQEALAAFYQRQAEMRQLPNPRTGNGAVSDQEAIRSQGQAPKAKQDNRSAFQRIIDALNGRY